MVCREAAGRWWGPPKRGRIRGSGRAAFKGKNAFSGFGTLQISITQRRYPLSAQMYLSVNLPVTLFSFLGGIAGDIARGPQEEKLGHHRRRRYSDTRDQERVRLHFLIIISLYPLCTRPAIDTNNKQLNERRSSATDSSGGRSVWLQKKNDKCFYYCNVGKGDEKDKENTQGGGSPLKNPRNQK